MTGFTLSAPFRGEHWERLDVAGQDSASTLPIMGVHATLSEDRIRITTRNEGTITGRLQGYDAHSLTLHVDSTEHIISYADMLSLKRSQGFRRYPIQGAWTGLGVGTVATLVVFPPTSENLEGWGGHRTHIWSTNFHCRRHRAGLAHRHNDTGRKMGAPRHPRARKRTVRCACLRRPPDRTPHPRRPHLVLKHPNILPGRRTLYCDISIIAISYVRYAAR